MKTIRGLPALLLFLVPTITQANVAPVVDNLSASTTAIAPGGLVSLQVDGHDPDCPGTCDSSAGCGQYIRADLNHWTSNGGAFENTDNGISGSPFTSTTDWRAPMTEGLYTISAHLPDNGGFLCGGRLTTTQDIQIQVTLNPNLPPVVDSIDADPTSLYPGETSDLTCVASDPDDDPLIYDWSAPSGTITPGAGGSAVFLATVPRSVAVTCTVTDTSAAPASDSVNLTVLGAVAEKWLGRGLAQPQRVAADPTGNVYVVDNAAGGIVVLDLFSGTVLYRIPVKGVTSVDIDWNGHLLVGLRRGAEVWNRAGDPMLVLDNASRDIIDVAVDHANRRYGVLDRRTSRVTVYDEFGATFVSFGSNGDGSDQCRTPHGLAATPAGGYWPDTHWAVADTGHGMVKLYNAGGNLASSFGASGGGVGEFINLVDIAVGSDDVIYGSDSFQSWIQAFNADGTVRETLGVFGSGLGELMTPAGVTVAEGFDRVVVTSTNSSRLQVFATTRNPASQGPTPLPTIDPSLSFPAREVGTSSNPLVATLRNDGEGTFGIAGVTIDGDFTQTGDCGDFLDPLQSCTFDVVFTPTVGGARTGELRVATTVDGEPLIVALDGTGFQSPAISVAPATLYFSGQTVGTTSTTQDLTVTNLGPGSLTISGIFVTGPYQQANDCPTALPEGQSCTIAVQFSPQALGSSFPGGLTVESSAIDAPHVVSLDGSGVAAGLQVADVVVIEGDADPVDAVFEIVLDGPSDGTFSVDYATGDDTALAGQDYQDMSGTLWFAAGEDRGTVTVPILPDTALEADEETFTLTLSNAVGAVIGDGTALGRIQDNEVCAGPNLLRNPGAESEAGGTGIPDWTEVSGYDWHPADGPTLPWEGGQYFFAGDTAFAQLEQVVDVSAFADRILDGHQVFEFEGYARGSDELPADGARVVVEYLHRTSGFVLDSYDSGEIVDSSAWQRLHDVREVPQDTGWIRVSLLATRYSGSSNEALFDGLMLRSHRAAVLIVSDNADYEGDPGTSFGLPFDVHLNCSYGETVSLNYATSPGTATKNLDYAYTAGDLEIPSGSTEVVVPVTVFGDAEDEAHETFNLNVRDRLPGDWVLQDGAGTGTIVNDDFCPRKANFWLKHPSEWPVYSLALGGVAYDQGGIDALLDYQGKNVPSEVARELAATKLNLAAGSPPEILATVVDADRFLTQYPPGSDPPRDALDWGQDLSKALMDYNKQGCQ